MDEAMGKSGEWPNVAIEAGTDPQEAKERYGVDAREGHEEAASAPQTAEPEPEPAGAGDGPQDGAKLSDLFGIWKPGFKTKKQLRAEAVERLKNCAITARGIVLALTGGRQGISDWSIERQTIIDLLLDDEPTCKPKQAVDKQAEQAGEVAGNAESYNLDGVSGGEIIGNGKSYKQADYGTVETETSQVPESDANGTGNRTCPNGNGTSSNDTREQLEADIREWWNKEYPGRFYTCNDFVSFAVIWLDRQAAITKDEWCNDRGWWNSAHESDCAIALCHEKDEQIAELKAERDSLENNLNSATEMLSETQRECNKLVAERDELKAFANRLETATHAKLGVTLFGVDYVTEEFMLHVRDTLTAERDKLQADLAECDENRIEYREQRDELREALEATELGQMHGMYIKACGERDHLKEVVQTQAESFRKMEADLKALNSGETLNTLRASVAGLKDTVEKQNAEIERIRDENAALCMKVHGAPF